MANDEGMKMELINDQAVGEWLRQKGLELNNRRVSLRGSVMPFIVVEIPKESMRCLALCAQLLLLNDSVTCPHQLFWISTWKIWSEWNDDFGQFVISNLRAQTKKLIPLSEASGHLFDNSDQQIAIAILWQTMLFNWDAFLVANEEYVVECSHDELVWITTKTEAKHQTILDALSTWNPKIRWPVSA